MTIGTGTPGDFTAFDTEQMRLTPNSIIGTRCFLANADGSSGLLYELTALPATTLANWMLVSQINNVVPVWEPYETTNYYGTLAHFLSGRDATLTPDGYDRAGFPNALGNGEQWNDIPLAAVVPVTASIAGTVMTVTAVGTATNPNGSTVAGVVKRGHYVTGDAGIPAGTYIIYDAADTGEGDTGTYKLSADCGTVASTSLELSCADGIGGVLTRVTDAFFGDGSSVDADAQKVWRFTIDPTHRVTVGRPRALIGSDNLALRKTYRVEYMFRPFDQTNGAWQTSNSTVGMPGPVGVLLLEQVSNTSYYDTDNSMGFGEQYMNNGPFAVNYDRGELYYTLRAPREDYAIKAADGYWSWTENDRWVYLDTLKRRYQMRGQMPVTLMLEFFLDERQPSEGGRGWLKAWINNELWCDYVGPTCYPYGRETGQIGGVTVRAGMYDVTTTTTHAANTLCSAERSAAIQRNLHIKYLHIKEAA